MLTVWALCCFRTEETRAVQTAEKLIRWGIQGVSKIRGIVVRGKNCAEITLLEAAYFGQYQDAVDCHGDLRFTLASSSLACRRATFFLSTPRALSDSAQ